MEPMVDASSYERILMQRAWDEKLPLNGCIELLPLCNMNCDMCYVRLSREEMDKLGSIKGADEWLQLGKEMQKAGVIFILLTGGEPLLHPEFKEIYLGLKSLGMIITLNTNATLLNQEWADFFAEYPPRRINITLYGASKETYKRLCHYEEGYDKVLDAIRLLQERNLDVRLGCSITERNKADQEQIIEIHEKLGIFTIMDTYMVSATRERKDEFDYSCRCNPEEAAALRIKALRTSIGDERFPAYIEQKIFEVENIVPEDRCGTVTCYAGNCSFAVTWQGNLQPCLTLTQPSANVFEVGFENAWKHVQGEVAAIRTSKHCMQCNLRPLCPNCAGNAMVETGSVDGVPDYLCRYAKETYRLMLLERNTYEKTI